jgi:hypothetical protein
MSTSAKWIRADSLGLAGVGLGLLVAFLIEPSLGAGPGDRAVIIAVVTAVVTMLWLIAVRLVFSPPVVPATVAKNKVP